MKIMKNQECKCKMCDGNGQYEGFFDDMYGGTHSTGVWHCQFCDGTGKNNALKEFKMIANGKRLLNELFIFKGEK